MINIDEIVIVLMGIDRFGVWDIFGLELILGVTII